jgi:superfamily I DNA/RNA helicase
MKSSKTPNSPLTFQKSDTVRWGTSLEFKGLESPVVIFIEFDDGAESSQASFYVAGTRATSELVTILNKKAIKAIRGDSTNE